MLAIVPLNITDAMVTSSSVAEPDTSQNEAEWSSSTNYVSSSEVIIASPSSTVTVTIASPCVVTWASNGLAVDTEVVPSTDGALPTGLVAGRTYYVAARLSADTFTLKDENDRTITTTGSQSGTHTFTAKVHKVYQSLINTGSSYTVTAVSTGSDTLTAVAHGFANNQPVIITSTGTMPAPLVSGTVYYVQSPAADTFSLASVASGSDINITSTGSGTITVWYGTSTVAPNYGKHPAIETTYWEEVGPTNKWAMFDSATATKTLEGTSPLRVTIVPGDEFDTVAFLGNEGVTGITLRHEINRGTATMTIASPCVVTKAGHGYAADTPVVLVTTGALPTGLAVDTTYYVRNPTTDTFELSATAGGGSITTTGSQSGTHTLGQVAYNDTLNASSTLPYATGIVSEANRAVAAYMNGTLTAILTGSGDIYCADMKVGVGTTIGTTVDDVTSSIKNYTVLTRDDFGNVTKTVRGYSKKLRCSVVIDANEFDIDEVSRFLTTNKDTDMLFLATDGLETHSIFGFIAEQEMSSSSENYKLLRLSLEGLLAT